MSGRVAAIDDHPKGWTMTSLWEYRDTVGTYADFRAANRDGKTVAELRVVENGN